MESSRTPGANYKVKQQTRYAIVAARFNGEIIERMLTAALDTLREHQVYSNRVDILHVPGAFEIPLTCKKLAETSDYAAVIALGCVIRGETPHFDYVAGECARGCTDAMLTTGIPIIFGVLTTDTEEQANMRSQVQGENKGIDVALCALEMTNVLAQVGHFRNE